MKRSKLTVVFICWSKHIHTCMNTNAHIHMHTQMHAYTHMHYWSWRAKILRKYSKGIAILKQARAVSLRDQWWMINLCSFPQAFLNHESEFSFLKEHFSIPSHMAFSFDFIRQKKTEFLLLSWKGWQRPHRTNRSNNDRCQRVLIRIKRHWWFSDEVSITIHRLGYTKSF